ncbi:MAG: hypothetical protein ACLFSB_13595 [Chitinispirillaceae bacterium]
MSISMQKKVSYTAIPVAVLGLAGVVMKKFSHKDGEISKTKQKVEGVVGQASHDIDETITDLKGNLEGKTASQLEKSIDSAVNTAKQKLDRIASETKQRIRMHTS